MQNNIINRFKLILLYQFRNIIIYLIIIKYVITDIMLKQIVQQRKKISFDVQKLKKFLYGDSLEKFQPYFEYLSNKITPDFNIYNQGRIQQMKQAYRLIPFLFDTYEKGNIESFLPSILFMQHSIPGGPHLGMFVTCIKLLGTDEQQKQLLQKCYNLEVFGCYAQTELGHGSDVQSLQTTATFDRNADQFILHTPTISASKFWPGDLAISANYAMVYAKLIIDDKSHGTHAFILKIRDQNHKTLPGIEIGDIGPTYGYITKDNGYMILNNVRIPRKNMLSRFVGVSKNGTLKYNGNPKILYASMMMIRKIIAGAQPKIYAQGITIAVRYSMIRKQFKNENKQEITIIQYQLQQNKLIPLVAEYYAVTIAGNNIVNLAQQNFKKLTQNNDDSLMAQTHSNLCIGKAYFSQLGLKGLQVCRLACGGHGYSHYSGLPSLITQYAPNVTHEGENTIIYLQIARYVLKSYQNYLKKKSTLATSVKYLESYDYLINKKCNVSIDDVNYWNIQQIRLLLAQATCYALSQVQNKFIQNQGNSFKNTWDKYAGLRLQQLAYLHSVYYTYYSFQQAIFKYENEQIKEILTNICMLYGLNQILKNPLSLIQPQIISGKQLKSLQNLKQLLLKKLRPHLIGLIDGFALPQKCIRSCLVSGTNIYQNLYNEAKKNKLNSEINPGVFILKQGLKNTTPKL